MLADGTYTAEASQANSDGKVGYHAGRLRCGPRHPHHHQRPVRHRGLRWPAPGHDGRSLRCRATSTSDPPPSPIPPGRRPRGCRHLQCDRLLPRQQRLRRGHGHGSQRHQRSLRPCPVVTPSDDAHDTAASAGLSRQRRDGDGGRRPESERRHAELHLQRLARSSDHGRHLYRNRDLHAQRRDRLERPPAWPLGRLPRPRCDSRGQQVDGLWGGLATFTASYSGFVPGDTAASLTTAVAFSTTAMAFSPSRHVRDHGRRGLRSPELLDQLRGRNPDRNPADAQSGGQQGRRGLGLCPTGHLADRSRRL